MDFLVDLVYLWADGNEASFRIRRQKYIAEHSNMKINPTDEANSLKRVMQFDEIKYSLRSAEKYMPWINHIYIVTDKQVPSFVNFKSKKISLIDIKEIAPKGVKELYSSNAIESLIYKIPNLSEHFIMSNDDFFVNKKISKDYFFTKEGKPIVYLRKYYSINNNYSLQIFNAYSEIFKTYNSRSYWSYSHNMDPYLVSDFKKVSNSLYGNALEATGHSGLRNNFEMNRYFISLYSFSNGNTILKKISAWKSLSTNLYCEYKTAWKVNIFKPFLFCLNAPANFSNNIIERMKKFLEKKYPEKSSFEK